MLVCFIVAVHLTFFLLLLACALSLCLFGKFMCAVASFIVIILNARYCIVVSKEKEAPHSHSHTHTHTHNGIGAELIRMCKN